MISQNQPTSQWGISLDVTKSNNDVPVGYRRICIKIERITIMQYNIIKYNFIGRFYLNAFIGFYSTNLIEYFVKKIMVL